MKKMFTLAALFLFSGAILQAQLVFEENFNYTAGTNLTANGWTAHSGAGSNSIKVVAPGLTYAGYAGSGIGNAARLITAGGEDVNRTFDSITSGPVYVAFLVRVDTSKTAGDYFLHLGARTMGTTFRPRVWVKGVQGGKFAFGVSPGTSVSTTALKFTDSIYDPGQTYLVVLKGEFGEVPKLFVNPVIGNPEPATPTVQSDTISDPTNYGTIALRQGGSTTTPGLVVDGIRIARTWSAAVAGTGTPANQPPVITNLTRDPFVPIGEATVGATVTDDYNVVSVKLIYNTGGTVDSTDMTSVGGNNYEAEIPAFANGTYVTYTIKATDDSNAVTISSIQRYLAGVTPINLLRQNDANMESIYKGVPVRVRGIVTAGDSTYSAANIDIYIQDATSGVNIFRSGGWTSYPEGRDLTVVGTVAMFNGKLNIANPNLQIIDNGAGTVPNATVITPAQLKSETYEGMLVIVTDVDFDASGIFDSTGQLRFGGTTYYFNNDSSNMIYLDRQLWDEFHGFPIPSGVVNVRGIASQYDVSSPFTSGYQLLPRKTADINVSISVKQNDPVYPKEFALRQNYPNPFNPTTAIAYDVPKAAEISIKVYNLLGQEIRTLFAGRQNPGRHIIQWDGRDNAGNVVSTGIYFYRMIGPDFTQTRKMIMMK